MMALMPPIRPAYAQIRPPTPPCTGCASPGDLVALQCPDQLGCSSSDQLTAQCTDQCVVIACSDPDHTDMVCGQAGAHAQCDFVCDETADCLDCHGLDAFLQCCEEYRTYGADSTRRGQPSSGSVPSTGASLPSAWETAFADWCAACAGMDSATTAAKGAEKTGEDSVHDASFQAGTSQHLFAGSAFPSHEAAPPSPSTADCVCMWAGCTAKFASLSELVGHVNLVHLMGTSSPGGSQTPVSSESSSSPDLSFACQWDNCGSSYYSSSNSFELLAHHLLNDHLHADPVQFSPHPKNNYLTHEQSHMRQQPQSHQPQATYRTDTYEQQIEQFHHRQHQHEYQQQASQYQHQNQHHQHHHHIQQQHQHQQPGLEHEHPQQQQQSTEDEPPSEEEVRVGQIYAQQMHAVLTGTASIVDFVSLPDPCPAPLPPLSTSSSPSQSDMSARTDPYQPLTQSTSTANHNCGGAHECLWKDCGLSFHSCDALTTHINDAHIGSGKAHYECFWEQCTRNGTHGFQSKQKISRHVQSHTGHRPFQCSICHQNFSEAATLQQHIRRHTQEKPYVCDYPGCGKSFAITGALTIHKRTHNGDKPFKCSYCDRGFAESSNLSKHLRTHTGARPYICSEPGCGKAFARPDQLNRHKGVHRKQIRGVNNQSS